MVIPDDVLKIEIALLLNVLLVLFIQIALKLKKVLELHEMIAFSHATDIMVNLTDKVEMLKKVKNEKDAEKKN